MLCWTMALSRKLTFPCLWIKVGQCSIKPANKSAPSGGVTGNLAKTQKVVRTLNFLLPDEDDEPHVLDQSELSVYCKEHAVHDQSPLEWWNENAAKYPEIACQFLSMLGASVTSERIFSSAGLVIKLRNRPSSSVNDQITFLNKNYIPDTRPDEWNKYICKRFFFSHLHCILFMY